MVSTDSGFYSNVSSSNSTGTNSNSLIGWDDFISLLLLIALSTVGIIGNTFTISAIMIDQHLKKKGKIYHTYRGSCEAMALYLYRDIL